MGPDDTTASSALIGALRDSRCYSHPVTHIHVVETHASWVILTGEHAYKIKKPVDLGFLDYSTLAKRHVACREELRLNRILAPELYLDVVPVTGSIAEPIMNGSGAALEYAVHMRQFDQRCEFDNLLEAGKLDALDMDALADHIAAFHLSTPVAPPASPYGCAGDIHQAALDNFSVITRYLTIQPDSELDRLMTWTNLEYQAHARLMDTRRERGFVRECHGDLHLANLMKFRGKILAFDRIEFSEPLRWLDVINDCAFLVMDLTFRGRRDLAWRFLNGYLQDTGDYAGLALLRYYMVYRALVRAKVALLRRAQMPDTALGDASLRDAQRYIALATEISGLDHPSILLTHGFSGSGKSWLSERLMTAWPAIRLRSDVERKRLHGLQRGETSQSETGAGIYSETATRKTYQHLAALAETVCKSGYRVIVDAAFLRRWQRDMFRALAGRIGVRIAIVDCVAQPDVLQDRIARRLAGAADASEADARVLASQLESAQPLEADELPITVKVGMSAAVQPVEVLDRLRELSGG